MDFFPRLLGNDGIKSRIGSAIRRGKVPHAFLIDGPSGSGKTTLALEIAAALNCEAGIASSPCGKCNTCRRIYKGEYVDVKTLKRGDDRATIGVAEIKEFRQDAFLSATEAEYKIYVIDDAEKLTPEAQNALLILLEEPPKGVVIMLLANGCDRILTTIKSRAQYLPLSRFTRGELEEHLRALSSDAERMAKEDRERFDVILTEADGVLGRALELTDALRSRTLMDERSLIVDFINSLGTRNGYSAVYSAISAFPTKRQELTHVLEAVMTALADMITVRRAEDAPTLFFSNSRSALEAGGELSERYLLAVYDAVLQSHDELNKNAGVAALLTTLAARVKLL